MPCVRSYLVDGLRSLGSTGAKLVHDRRGSIGMIFGMALVPMTIFTGASIDYARAVRTRNVMQAALNSAILAAAQKTSSLNDSEFTTQVNAIYAANGGMDVHADTISVSVTRTNEQVTGQVTASSPNTLMQIVGIANIPLAVTSKVMLGTGDMEVVLVLDNTGSMRGNMGALKTGATDLANALFDKAGTATLKVAVVPYVGAVNIGNGGQQMAWMDINANSQHHGMAFRGHWVAKEAGCVLGPDPGGGGGGGARRGHGRHRPLGRLRQDHGPRWLALRGRHARHSRHLDRAGQPDGAPRLFDHHPSGLPVPDLADEGQPLRPVRSHPERVMERLCRGAARATRCHHHAAQRRQSRYAVRALFLARRGRSDRARHQRLSQRLPRRWHATERLDLRLGGRPRP